MNRSIHMPDGIHEVPRRDVIAFVSYAAQHLGTMAPECITRGGAYVRKGLLDAVIFLCDEDRVVEVRRVGKTRKADIVSWLVRHAPGYRLTGLDGEDVVPGWAASDDLTNEDSIKMLDIIKRRRNLSEPTGEPFEAAFSQGELVARGWTVSMIERHIGNPNSVIRTGQGVAYNYDTRRVYAAEGTPQFQRDLLALEAVRTNGVEYLTKLPCYIPDLMFAALSGLSKTEADAQRANAYGGLAYQVYRLTRPVAAP